MLFLAPLHLCRTGVGASNWCKRFLLHLVFVWFTIQIYTMKNNNNNEGYEYEIVTDNSLGLFVEVYKTDERGERAECHFSMFVNSNDGESIKDAIAATEVELFDAVEQENNEFVEQQRIAFSWFKDAYASIMDAKENT